MKYKAYLIEENEGKFSGSIKELDAPSLAEGRVLIKVKYSSLNYKDALASSGAKGVVRSYPFVLELMLLVKLLNPHHLVFLLVIVS